MSERIIEWDSKGYPTEESLEKLKQAINNTKDIDGCKRAVEAFYSALEENIYEDYCGSAKVEVRGEVIDVWEYHTGGWSGNEAIINTLQQSWLWNLLLERYDRGGHYYFTPKDKAPFLNIKKGDD